jgi:peptidoglycan/LPS O-acetylase OafA/YrhL
VLAVIAYHLNFGWASGGLLGVQVFFVLSGYLITDLLMAEYGRHRGIGLKNFWIRRARRLLPALFVMLFVVVGWATLFDRSQLAALRSDLPAGIFYFSNWWYIFHHVSYFARFGPPSPLGHLWSLAIEEQFYLVWPLLILAGFRWLHTRRKMILVTLGVASVSALEMALLYSSAPGFNPTRIYDGTDTRAFALLIGAALAMWLPRNRPFAAVTPNARRLLNIVGGAALLGIFAMYWGTTQYGSFPYQGGMFLLAVLTALVIGVTVHPGSQLRIVLGWEPLRWVGERSYGIYLWHYPVIVLTTPLNAQPNVVRASLQIAATFVIAALSWRYVEQPVRHGSLGRQWDRIRSRDWNWPRLRPVGWVLVGGVLANAAICGLGLFGVVSASAADPASQITSIVPGSRHHVKPPTTTPKTPPGVAVSTTTTAPPPAGQDVTAIGDSIMIDAAPYLQQMLPGIAIDAQVGQQLYQVQEAVSQLKAEGAVGDRLILELGTNGPYSVSQMKDLINSLGPMRRIVLVNTRVPRPWQQQVNETITTVARFYPNATVVNWYADSAAYPQYFYPDGVHLDPTGARYYASLLAQAVKAPPPRRHGIGSSHRAVSH